MYDYYIFIDDDITFELADGSLEDRWDVAPTIKRLLEEYSPVMATFNSRKWHFKGIIEKLEKKDKGREGIRKVFPFVGQDLDCQILSDSFAKVMFPVVYHGTGFSTWYFNYVCHKLFPKKQMVFSDVRLGNLRKNSHKACVRLPHCRGAHSVANLFNENTFDKDFPMGREEIIDLNLLAYKEEVDKSPVKFTLNDLAKIYDINNLDWQNRKATVESKKVVGVGFRKTGTTSLGECFRKVFKYKTCGFRQRSSPKLMNEWERNEFGPVMKNLVASFTAFEDIPWPFLYKLIDKNCPSTKFILTIRDPERWFESWKRYFKEKAFEHPGEIKTMQIIYGISKPEQIEKEQFIERFNRHNREVIEYFKDRPNDLLVVNWAKGNDLENWKKLCDFLGEKIPEQSFPKALMSEKTRESLSGKQAKGLFVHIPRTGGTSVKDLCKFRLHKVDSHLTYTEIVEKLKREGKAFDFSFAVVRNPWARLVSAYEYAKMDKSRWHDNVNGKRPHPDYNAVKGKSFEEVVKMKIDGYNFKHPSLRFDQAHFIADKEGEILVDYIVHLENFAKEFKSIEKKLGITKALGFSNKSDCKQDYQTYYTEETKKAVAKIYKQDIALFGYRFGD
jgi:hypothetical protein